uniref:Uncharacterized protein n=1 Tax=Arundo donax TaxID=35708 RepID=A0A0A9D3F5_ARUDO
MFPGHSPRFRAGCWSDSWGSSETPPFPSEEGPPRLLWSREPGAAVCHLCGGPTKAAAPHARRGPPAELSSRAYVQGGSQACDLAFADELLPSLAPSGGLLWHTLIFSIPGSDLNPLHPTRLHLAPLRSPPPHPHPIPLPV